MTGLTAALEELSGQLRWEPATGLSIDFGGRRLSAGAREDAVMALRDHVYARYFCRMGQGPSARTRYSGRASGEPAFVAGLVAAAQGASCWEPGWSIVKAEAGWAFVSNGRLNLFVDDRARLAPAASKVGARVRVRMPCVRENLSPGFLHLVSRAGPLARQSPYSKLYLNLAPEGAAPLVEALLRVSRLERVRFEAKVANSPSAYCRVDTALIDAPPSSLPVLVAFLRGRRSWFRIGTPLFTREVAPGLAVGEALAGPRAESFGQRRCRLVAEEVVRALETGEPSAHAWLARIAARFGNEGL